MAQVIAFFELVKTLSDIIDAMDSLVDAVTGITVVTPGAGTSGTPMNASVIKRVKRTTESIKDNMHLYTPIL